MIEHTIRKTNRSLAARRGTSSPPRTRTQLFGDREASRFGAPVEDACCQTENVVVLGIADHDEPPPPDEGTAAAEARAGFSDVRKKGEVQACTAAGQTKLYLNLLGPKPLPLQAQVLARAFVCACARARPICARRVSVTVFRRARGCKNWMHDA